MWNWLEEQYEEYLQSFEAWGREFFSSPVTLEAFEELQAELEQIGIDEECGLGSPQQRERRDQIEKRLLTHDSYFEYGPRVTIVQGSRD